MFSSFVAALPSTLEQGLIYGVLALGIMITYSILDVPDLTVDGSFPLGGAVATSLTLAGMRPLPALLIAMAAGGAAGLCTGLIHVRLKVRALFSGIIMMTALYSINLRIAGGRALLSIPRDGVTFFRNNPAANALPDAIRVAVIAGLLLLLLKLLLDGFLRTRAGYLLRAAGDNEAVVTQLGRDKGNVKILGLVMSNALVALSGAVFCQQQRMFEISMGTGAMVLGLASVIIGINLLRKAERAQITTKVIVGAVLYKLCVSAALSAGLSPMDMKLITAVLFLLILAGGYRRREARHA